MLRKDCFAYKENRNGATCTALTKMECDNCKFFSTKADHVKKMKELENRRNHKE